MLDQGIFPQGGVIAIVLRDGEVHHDGGHGAAALAPAPARDGTVTARPLRPGGVVAGQAVQGEVAVHKDEVFVLRRHTEDMVIRIADAPEMVYHKGGGKGRREKWEKEEGGCQSTAAFT